MTKYLTITIALGVSLAVSTLARTIAPANQPSKKPSIWIGMQLRLGMSRDDIISKLTANYKLTKVQDTDDWIVAEKQNAEIWQGYLGFHGTKLTYASRSWTQASEDTFAFAHALCRS